MTMAEERDIELLDDYITNRMGEENRTAFEQKIKSDPDLQQEYALQKRMVQGLKDARISELKSMLNNVVIPSAGTGNTQAFKIVIATVATVVIGAVAYWYFHEDVPAQLPETKIQAEQPVATDATEMEMDQPQVQPETKTKEQALPRLQERNDADKNQTSAGTEHSKPSLAKRPAPLSAPAPSGNRTSDNQGDVALTPVAPSFSVETERNKGRYSFHYQFRDGKLFLFGPFEDDRYEVIELLRDEKKQVFLFFENQYYSLEHEGEQINPLIPVKDPALTRKLDEQRNSK